MADDDRGDRDAAGQLGARSRLGKSSVIALIVGIALLDLGAQGLHISNQSAIYALRPDARSRLTTAYMVTCFLGASLFSALAAIALRQRRLGRRVRARCDHGGARARDLGADLDRRPLARAQRASRLEPAGDRAS